VRRWLSCLLPECPARDDVLSVAVELGSNALQHTRSGMPGGWFAVEVTWDQSVVQLAVADGGGPAEPRVIDDRDGERGRGLLLVRGLSVRTGWTGDERSRLVWAQIAWPDHGPGAAEPSRNGDQTAIGDCDQVLALRLAVAGHLPAQCGCHALTPACPVDCLAVVLSTATFHALTRAEHGLFDPPATVGQVLELWRAKRLGLAAGLGRRRLGEIEAALVMAGFLLGDPDPPGRSLVPGSAGRDLPGEGLTHSR